MTGDRVYVLPLPRVPIATPVGFVPGELRIEVSKDGHLTGVKGVLMPPSSAVRDAALVLSNTATFHVDEWDLARIGDGDRVIATFAMSPAALADLSAVRVLGTADLDEMLGAPGLLVAGSFALADFGITSERVE